MNETPRFPSAPRRDGNGLEPGLRQGRNPAHRPCPRGVATGESRLLDAFRDGLSALGWTDGSNLSVLDRWAEERTEVLPALVKELIGSGVTILVTAGTSATLAATRANATIPIVLVGVDDPVSLGLVDTLMQPGGKVTGLSLSLSEVIAERLELLRQLVRPCRTAMEPRGPTLKRHSWLHQRIVGLARKRSSASGCSHADGRLTSTHRAAPLLLSDRRC